MKTMKQPEPFQSLKGADSLSEYRKRAIEMLAAIPVRSPRELNEQLSAAGYMGQEKARRKMCLMAYRHVRRLRNKFLSKSGNEAMPKCNALMLGPTGTGKTYMTELLFGRLIGVPVICLDMTGFSETGYMGRSVSEIPHELLMVARGNPFWAMMGICIMDEFDKLAGSSSNVRFAGEGTTKDVSGYGVQRELLKLLEGGTYSVSLDNQMFGGVFRFRMNNVGVVACGAFSGIKEIAVLERGTRFGFGREGKDAIAGGIAYQLSEEDVASIDVFCRYGFLPELVARFSSFVRLSPLNRNELKDILIKNVLPAYEAEFELEGRSLKIQLGILNELVDHAVKSKTGARGLVYSLESYIENRAYEEFGTDYV